MPTSERQQPKKTRQAKSRIPTFKTIAEEAAFWDARDSTEFEEEFEDVTEIQFVKAQPKKAFTVRLEEDMFAALTQQARNKGLSPSTLARMWILERLRKKEGPTPPPKVS